MPGTYQYFRETDQHYQTKKFGAISHCDPRYCPSTPPEIDATRRSLIALLSSYSDAMTGLGVESWVAHGALLGWYWNNRLLPWDTDIDVQMSFDTLEALAASYNMTQYKYTLSGESSPRIYTLDINPHFLISSTADVANKIDARWIDTSNGKYIDITAVRTPGLGETSDQLAKSLLFCKDGHQYPSKQLFPLVESKLEDIRVLVPQNAAEILAEEYGRRSLTNGRFHWYHFNKKTKTWEAD